MLRRSLCLCLLIVLLVSTLWTPKPSAAQDQTDTLLPTVIDTYPPEGAEISPDEPLTITFDQPMNRATVEAALTIDPTLKPRFTWVDGQTLELRPESAWPGKTRYTVTITGSATATTGQPLTAPYTYRLRTQTGLAVGEVSPRKDAADIALDSKLVISFNRPVIGLGDVGKTDSGNLITITPTITGKGEWVNTAIYTFTPSSPLTLNTTYTAKIAPGLKAVDGTTLEVGYEWSYTTRPPLVEKIGPYRQDYYQRYNDAPIITNVQLDSSMRATFAQPMDTASTEAAFALTLDGRSLPGKFTWMKNNTELEFKPDQRLQLEAEYKVSVGIFARAQGGGTLKTAVETRFQTRPYPAIYETYPENGARDVKSTRVFVAYNFFLNSQDYEVNSSVVIIPTLPFTTNGVQNGFSISANFVPETFYTITVKAGIRDQDGNATKNDYIFSFTTGKKVTPPRDKPRFKAEINGDFMVSSAANTNTSVRVTFNDPTPVQFNLYRLPPTELSSRPMINHQLWGSFSGYGSFDGGYSNGLTNCTPPPTVRPENLVRSWSHTRGTDDNASQQIYIASEQGGTLPLGLYWLTIGEENAYCDPDRNANPPRHVDSFEQQFGIAVVSANMTIKRGTEDTFIWLTALSDSAPVAGATVKVYNGEKLLATGTTETSGAVRLPVRVLENPFVIITADAPGMFAAWYNFYSNAERGVGRRFDGDGGYYGEDDYYPENYYEAPPNTQAYIYTDRPVYRPGDTVKFRGVLRNKRDMAFPVPEAHTAYMKIGEGSFYYGYFYADDSKPLLSEGTMALNAFGSFSGEYRIPKDATTGNLYIRVSPFKRTEETGGFYGYDRTVPEDALIGLTIANYRTPEFEVRVTPDQPIIFQGDPLGATIQGSYYFGGGVGKADVKWTTVPQYTAFRFTGGGKYRFGGSSYYRSYYRGLEDEDDEPDYYSYNVHTLDIGTATTDSNGRATVTSTKTLEQYQYGEDHPRYPIRLTLEGTVSDESGQAISGRASVIAHPANLYIGLSDKGYVLPPGKIAQFDLIAVNADSTPRANQTLTLQTTRNYWSDGSSGSRELPEATVTTGADGKAQYSFTPTESGWYEVTIGGKDEKGRPNFANGYYWVTEDTRWSFSDTSKSLQIITDKNKYQPGETAEAVIPVPFNEPGYALITVERAGVITHSVLPTRDGIPIRYQVPITGELAPTAYIKAIIISAPDEDHAYPRYRITFAKRISVEPSRQRLTVSVTPSARQTKPGETVRFDVQVNDADGKPVVAEVGLALVDKAVLALLPPNSKPIEKTFYQAQQHRVYTDLSLDGLLERFKADNIGPDGRGGGGGPPIAPPYTLREKFETTPLWMPHLVTDDQGRASVSVKLPDNLTTWQLDARAWTLDMKVGQTTTEIQTSLPLIVRPVAPRFFVAGDQVTLAAIIQNNTERDQDVTATLESEGVILTGQPAHAVTIPAGGRARVTWPVTVADVASVSLVFNAASTEGLRDAAKPTLTTSPNGTIPVYRYRARDLSLSTSGVLRTSGGRTEGITLPPRYKSADGDLVVRVDPSLGATITDSFTYLRQYPYFCIEQTVSRFLPNVTTYRALKALNQTDPALEANLQTPLTAALKKLIDEQKPDGSWGWYPGMKSDPLTSAYATLGLIEARKSGVPLPLDLTAMTDKALANVRTQVRSPLGLENWGVSRQAFYAYVLARAGSGDKVAFDALFAVRTRLSIASRAYLLMAYAERFPDAPEIAALTTDLLSTATLGATGAHWQEAETDWWNWGTDIRTTALALNALLRVMPDSDLLPNVVRWLMTARQADHWPTTQETVWSVTALTDWMLRTGELRGNYTYALTFNRKNLSSTAITPEKVREAQTLRIAVRDLLAGHVNKLLVTRGEGDGALYYTARFDLQVPAGQAQAANHGLSVTREYFNVTQRVRTPITSAKIGDVITVRLTITASEDIRYFVLDDPFPSGTEGIDRTLLTASRTTQDNDDSWLAGSDAYWYWGWWAFEHTELRDSQLTLNADYLRSGTYVYTYQVRATLPGVFQTMPSSAYSFYFPEVFGRSAGNVFTIADVCTQAGCN